MKNSKPVKKDFLADIHLILTTFTVNATQHFSKQRHWKQPITISTLPHTVSWAQQDRQNIVEFDVWHSALRELNYAQWHFDAPDNFTHFIPLAHFHTNPVANLFLTFKSAWITLDQLKSERKDFCFICLKMSDALLSYKLNKRDFYIFRSPKML